MIHSNAAVSSGVRPARCTGWKIFLILMFVLLAVVSGADAQLATSGTINGTVVDQTGAFIPHANVTITSLDTHTVTKTVTNSSGIFSQVGLASGNYMVTVVKKGFATFSERAIYLDPAGTYTIHAALKPGAASAAVVVNGQQEQVQVTTSEISNIVTEQEVEDLPLNGRNYEQLAALMPGVINTSVGTSLGTGGYTTDTSMSVNGGATTTPGGQGAAPNSALRFVDGIWDAASVEHDQNIITPNPDSISEIKVLQNNYGAAYSVMGASVVLLQTKSGASNYHGDLWEFLRNTAFDATPYLATSPSILHWNIYGWDLGGPLRIPHFHLFPRAFSNKTFFYFNQQWVRQTQGGVITGSTPTATMRGQGTPGNEALIPMTGVFAPSGGYLKDPTLSGSCSATSNAACFGTDGNGNWVIPSYRIDQNALAMLNALADLPNDSNGAVSGFDNYINTNPNVTHQMDIVAKLDHDLTSRLRLTGEYLTEEQTFSGANAARMGSPFSKNYDVFATDNQAGQIRLTQILSPSMVNQTSVATSVFDVTHDYGGIHLIDQIPGFQQNLPYTGGYLQNYLPSISFSDGWSKFGTGAAYIVPRATEVHTTISDDWNWQLGKHFLQAGGILLFGIERHSATSGSTMGQWSFTGQSTGSPIADYLLGDAATFEQTNTGTRTAMKYSIFSPYVQDEWRALPRLTITAGLRWFRMPWPTEPAGYMTAFDPAAYNAANAPTVATNGQITVTPDYSRTNGIILNGVDGVPLNLTDEHKYYIAPMVGFAWDVYGNGHTSLRGGYGLTHNETAGQGCAEQGCLGYPVIQQVNLNTVNFTNPTNGATTAPLTAQAVNGQDLAHYKAANIQTFSLSVQQAFGSSWWLSLAGAGSITHGLLSPNINQPPPIPGYDFDPRLSNGYSSAYFAPYQGYTTIDYYENVERAYWTAMEMALRHRAAKGLYLTVAYTWSHNLDNTGGFQSSYNLNSAYGNSTYNTPQAFNVSLIYSIPHPSGISGWKSVLLSGWRYSDMTTVYSGKSMSLGLSTGSRGLATRPDLVAPVTYPKKLDEWFSIDSFAAPAEGFFGNVGNGTLRGPGVILFNMAAYKDFFTERRAQLEFRAEYFNVFNHLNPNNPATSVGSNNIGTISGAKNPREGEFALRVRF